MSQAINLRYAAGRLGRALAYGACLLALVVALAGCGPAATPTPSGEPNTPEPTQTVTLEQVTIPATSNPTPSSTPTHVPPPLPTLTSSHTPTPQPSDTATRTSVPPTATATWTIAPPTPTATPTLPAWADLQDQCAALLPQACAELPGLAQSPRYDIEVTVSLEPDPILNGHLRVLYWNQAQLPMEEVYFRLYPNASTYGGSLRVGSLTTDGKTADYTLMTDDTALRVSLPRPLLPGEHTLVEVSFETIIPRDSDIHYQILNYARGMATLANFYPTLAVHDEDGWDIDPILEQGDSAYCETSFYRVRVTAAANMVLAASGTEVARTHNSDGTHTWVFVTGPIRDFGLAMSQRYQVAERQEGDVLVRSFYLPEDAPGGAKLLAHAADALRIYQHRFGGYPYRTLDMAQAPIDTAGMEFPSMIMIQNSQYRRTDGYDEFVVVHEVAHQWWYNLVGNNQQQHPWVDEGLATYSTVIYYQDRYQRNEEGRSLSWYLQAPYQRAVDAGRDSPVNLSVDNYAGFVYYRMVYAKAGLFYHALRQRLGDDEFFALLRAYQETYRWGLVTGEDVIAFWMDRASQDVSDLVARWILGPAR